MRCQSRYILFQEVLHGNSWNSFWNVLAVLCYSNDMKLKTKCFKSTNYKNISVNLTVIKLCNLKLFTVISCETLCTCACVCVCVHMHVCVCECVTVSAYMYECVAHVCVCACVCVHVWVCIHVCLGSKQTENPFFVGVINPEVEDKYDRERQRERERERERRREGVAKACTCCAAWSKQYYKSFETFFSHSQICELAYSKLTLST